MSLIPGNTIKAIPAQLSFLAIYNPSLGPTDETFRDQVVFYHSRVDRARRRNHDHRSQHGSGREETDKELREEENEKLRQIGLAQGMVGFAKGFANGKSVDSVETEKSRIVLKEVEEGWWILASIELTRLPVIPSAAESKISSKAASRDLSTYEYSSRDVSPPELLLEQLLRAHRIFRLHHGPSLSTLYTRMQRLSFCGILERYWTQFASHWDVLLHSNPVRDMYRATKLAAGGELGIGVGEEEWGSGEREVFEDFIGRTDGLVDMVISRFGSSLPQQQDMSVFDARRTTTPRTRPVPDAEPWLGVASCAEPSDGIVFSGTGSLSKSSLVDVSDWLQTLYCYGEHAYGIKNHPSSTRRGKTQRRSSTQSQVQTSRNGKSKLAAHPSRTVSTREHPMIPPPIVAAAEQSLSKASAAADAGKHNRIEKASRAQSPSSGPLWSKYLTLGYGSAWGPGSGVSSEDGQQEESRQERDGSTETRSRASTLQHVDPEPEGRRQEEKINAQIRAEHNGHFIIGLQGDFGDENDYGGDDIDEESWVEAGTRLSLRTLYLQILPPRAPQRQQSSQSYAPTGDLGSASHQLSRLRVIVYGHRPFIYAFFFQPETDSLALPAFYRKLHTFFAPLHRPLNISTSPEKVAARLAALASPVEIASTEREHSKDKLKQPIFDVLFDPVSMVLSSNIPNIPEPGSFSAEGLATLSVSGSTSQAPPWTRAEALNVHSQILATINATRRAEADEDIERTAKTSRGWWIVWMRMRTMHGSSKSQTEVSGQDMPPAGTERPELTQQTPLGDIGESAFLTDSTQYPPRAQSEDQRTPSSAQNSTAREAILVRRSRDAATAAMKSGARGASGMWTFGLGGDGLGSLKASTERGDTAGGEVAGWGPARLAEGIGIDARRYVEGLLSLNR